MQSSDDLEHFKIADRLDSRSAIPSPGLNYLEEQDFSDFKVQRMKS